MLSYSLVILSLLTLCHGQRNWALLVAGSKGYSNYRHQADVCHAYHVLIEHGFPRENIVTMMYDDIAYNKQNPFPGNIINRPNGTNVYTGVEINYSKDEVNPETFVKVLTGDSEGILKSLGRYGKVIESQHHDRIFVNFVDHGSPGYLHFPSDNLSAKDFHKAILTMHKEKRYRQMVFYIEACESGSMFDGYPYAKLNVYATTAANPDESSYACYYDEARDTYLGDTYSVSWMQDSDIENLRMETLDSQFKIVRNETKQSHVMRYGNRSMGFLKISDFQGNHTRQSLYKPSPSIPPIVDAVPSEQVVINILKRKLAKAKGEAKILLKAELNAEIKKKNLTVDFFKNLATVAAGEGSFDDLMKAPIHIMDSSCYYKSVQLIREMCPGIKLIQNEYAHRKLRVVVNLCRSNVPDNIIFSAIGKVSFESVMCSKYL